MKTTTQTVKMTPEQINTAIAKACGWKFKLIGTPAVHPSWTCSGVDTGVHGVPRPPDYYHSLDDCADFERTLDKIQRREYVRQLYHITENDFGAHCATAPQRCEAFLRLHNKWIESSEPK